MSKHLKMIAGGVVGSGLIVASTIGAVSADSHNASGNVGSSGIPRSVFKQERLDAASQVLNTTTANVQAAHKNKTFAQLVSQAGLTKKTYHQKLKTQLTTDLEAQGYSQSQITIALQHREIVRQHHRIKSDT
jgi:hypothetical protein